ncbi:vasculin-like [Oppia nitens]|uniref:vasculin-like n=1 Tax=Oppia nitens TaxID=1686743 RepID=UPI0023D9961B|nr:vasculin-like [Oppia nitens]
MESPNAPLAQDFFTPAWLKLPEPQLPKRSTQSSQLNPLSSGVDLHNKRYANFGRKELTNSTNSLTNSDRFSNQSQDSSQTYLRHHSFGSEQQYNGSNGSHNVKGFREKKYTDSGQRSHRHNYREKPNNVYHSSNKHNRNADTFKNFNSPTRKSFTNKLNDNYLDNEFEDKRVTKEQNSNNVFNREFPSLVNNEVKCDQKDEPLNDNSSFHSAWTNSATKSKVLSTSKNFQLIHSSVANFDNIHNNTKSDAISSANASKPLISSGVYRNISLIGKSKAGILKENTIFPRIQPMITKSTVQTTTPTMEILMKNPKKRSNKNDFFNSIQNDNKDKEIDNEVEEKLENLKISSDDFNNIRESEAVRNSDHNQTNGENDLKNMKNSEYHCPPLDDYEEQDMGVLSSSLEAEHRLLMELGWKDGHDDDPSYAPLTEDEVMEFKASINARNGMNGYKRNFINNQTIQLNLSPKKWSTNEELDEESTSSSDDE